MNKLLIDKGTELFLKVADIKHYFKVEGDVLRHTTLKPGGKILTSIITKTPNQNEKMMDLAIHSIMKG